MEKPRRNAGEFAAFAGLSILISVPVVLVWWMSPLGFCFSNQPDDPAMRAFALAIYGLSYTFGIPILLVAQVVSIVLLVLAKSRAAFLTSAIALTLFLAVAGLASALLAA